MGMLKKTPIHITDLFGPLRTTAVAEGVGGIQYTRERKIDCVGIIMGMLKKGADIYNRPLWTTAVA